MNKFFKKALLAISILAMCVVFTAPALAYDHYVINVYADTGFSTAAGGYTPITSGVRYIVFNGGGGKVLSTLYSDTVGNAKSNPVEATTFNVLDRIDFYIDSTVTSVDIAIMTLNGYATWLRGATTSTRTVIIDQKPGLHTSFADYSVTKASMNGLTGTATDYWTFESDTVLLPWFGLEVITATCASDGIQLFGDLSNTAGALFNYGMVDAAKTFTWASQIWGQTADCRTTGSVFETYPCVADGGTYADPGRGYLVATGETMTFSGASLPETGAANTSITTDLANGCGFYHFWFIKLR